MSVNILKLSETGKLFEMKNKWWKNKDGACEKNDDGDSSAMGFAEVRGIFYTLFLGLFAAYFLGICEFLMHVHSRASEEKVSASLMKIDFTFVYLNVCLS